MQTLYFKLLILHRSDYPHYFSRNCGRRHFRTIMCQISGKALPLIVVVLWFRSFAFTVQILQASLLLIWTTERLAYLMQLGGVIIADSSIKRYLQDICFDHNPRTAAECGCEAPYDLLRPSEGSRSSSAFVKSLKLKETTEISVCLLFPLRWWQTHGKSSIPRETMLQWRLRGDVSSGYIHKQVCYSFLLSNML